MLLAGFRPKHQRKKRRPPKARPISPRSATCCKRAGRAARAAVENPSPCAAARFAASGSQNWIQRRKRSSWNLPSGARGQAKACPTLVGGFGLHGDGDLAFHLGQVVAVTGQKGAEDHVAEFRGALRVEQPEQRHGTQGDHTEPDPVPGKRYQDAYQQRTQTCEALPEYQSERSAQQTVNQQVERDAGWCGAGEARTYRVVFEEHGG